MKILGFIFIFLVLSLAKANPIIGTWKFTEYSYEGHILPEPNPDLDLRFTFDDKGFSILKWLRTNESGICERLANYSVEPENILHQKTIWVNPSNDISCGSDPEMKLENETFTNFHIENDKLYLELALDGKPFIYILTRL